MAETTPDPVDDEQEIEISGYDPSGWRRWSRPLPAQRTPPHHSPRARWRIAALVALTCLLGVGLGVPDLRASLAERVLGAFGAHHPVPPVVARATPAPLAPAIPLIPAPPLAAAPRDCPTPPPLTTAQVPFYGTAVGKPPVFVIGLSGPHPTLRLGGVTGQTYTAYGWPALLIWALAPGYGGAATLHVTNLADGSSVPISAGFSNPPAASVVLNPNDQAAPPQHPQWSLWSGAIYLPRAGCFMLEASSSGGVWALPFAAGR